MALIVLSCPKCGGNQWSMHDINESKYLCERCNKWSDDSEFVLDYVEAEINE